MSILAQTYLTSINVFLFDFYLKFIFSKLRMCYSTTLVKPEIVQYNTVDIEVFTAHEETTPNMHSYACEHCSHLFSFFCRLVYC